MLNNSLNQKIPAGSQIGSQRAEEIYTRIVARQHSLKNDWTELKRQKSLLVSDVQQRLSPKQLFTSDLGLSNLSSSHPLMLVGAAALSGFIFTAILRRDHKMNALHPAQGKLASTNSTSLGNTVVNEISATTQLGIRKGFDFLRNLLEQAIDEKQAARFGSTSTLNGSHQS